MLFRKIFSMPIVENVYPKLCRNNLVEFEAIHFDGIHFSGTSTEA